jgi:hypothetical protein
MNQNWQFSYAGIEFPPPVKGGLNFVLQPVDDVATNANGDIIIQPITLRYTSQASWSALAGEEAHLIMSTLAKNRVGELVFYNIAKGEIDRLEVYYGAGVRLNYSRYDDDMEKQLYTDLSINFITTTGENYRG